MLIFLCALCTLCDFLLGLLNDCRVQLSICWYSPEPPGAPDQLPQQPLLIAGQMSFGMWQHTLSKQYTHSCQWCAIVRKRTVAGLIFQQALTWLFFFRTMDSVYCLAVSLPTSHPLTSSQVLMTLLYKCLYHCLWLFFRWNVCSIQKCTSTSSESISR